MKKRAFVLMLVVGALCGCSWLLGPQLSGRWEGAAELAMTDPTATRTTEIVLVLVEDHGVVTGTLRCPEFFMDPADVTGTLSGRHVELESTILGDVTFTGEVHGDTMSGTCTYHGFTDSWEVTRTN